jgi:hypothetical protein
MGHNIYITILFFLSCLTSLRAQIDNEANFYSAVAHANYNKDLVTDYSVDSDFETDDSVILQTAIDNIKGVTSVNSGFAVRIEGGFVSSYKYKKFESYRKGQNSHQFWNVG